MDVKNTNYYRTEEQKINSELLLAVKLLSRLYPPGAKEKFLIPELMYKKQKRRLTLCCFLRYVLKLIYRKPEEEMKKGLTLFFVAFCVMFYCYLSAGENKKIEHVQSFNNIKKAELYKRSLSYIAKNYNSANDVIQLKDPESAQIVCRGVSPFEAYMFTYYFSYTLTIDIKNNKVRTTFENIQGQKMGRTPAANVSAYWDNVVKSVESIRSEFYKSLERADDNW